jgi:hypothetical protein
LASGATFEEGADDMGLAALDAFPVARGCRRARHYLAALERKPGALRNSVLFKGEAALTMATGESLAMI